MLDELAIYNLLVKYPDTKDLIKAVYEMAIDDCVKELNRFYDESAYGKDYPEYNDYCVAIDDCAELLDELKENNNDD